MYLYSYFSWICFSQLPYLPEMDALQNDLKIINQCYQHLSKTNQSDDLSYIDAYKYTFSRTGIIIINMVVSYYNSLLSTY